MVDPGLIAREDGRTKKKSFMKVIQALEEVDRFITEDMPEDSQLNAEYSRAEKRASKLHEKLQDACNDLSTSLVTPDHSIGFEFYDYISEFVEETRDNDKARKRAAEMKDRLSSRGIVTHQTNISTDQIKSQLPTFTGESSRFQTQVLIQKQPSKLSGLITSAWNMPPDS